MAALVQLALDMREAVATRTFGDQNLAFRISVNSGPMVAGVIGARRSFLNPSRPRRRLELLCEGCL